MKPLILTPGQAAALDALCEFGQTDLAARRLNKNRRSIENYVAKAMLNNGYPNRLTLVLARDRENRKNDGSNTGSKGQEANQEAAR